MVQIFSIIGVNPSLLLVMVRIAGEKNSSRTTTLLMIVFFFHVDTDFRQ